MTLLMGHSYEAWGRILQFWKDRHGGAMPPASVVGADEAFSFWIEHRSDDPSSEPTVLMPDPVKGWAPYVPKCREMPRWWYSVAMDCFA